MPSQQSCWEIYNKEMSKLNHGHALWEPAPLSYFKRIQPGDVGYIRTGCFHLLFSAGCPLGGRQLGVDVPPTFEQLEVGPILNRQPRAPGCLPTNNVRAGRVRLRRPTSPPSTSSSTSSSSISSFPMLESGSTISFRLTGGQGAALVTKYQTFKEDIQRVGTFEKYTRKHYASWVAFARETGHGDDINPFLVTGVDRTRDFAMMSYANDDGDMSSEFTTSVSELASVSGWGTWHTTGFVFTNCGPQLCYPPSFVQSPDVTLSGDNNTEPGSDWYDQCVFVRYYTVRKRLGIPKVIKAGAGPHNPGTGSREDGESPKVEGRSPSDSGSDVVPSLYDNDEFGDRSSATSLESESDTVIHNTASDGEDDFDAIADYVFRNSDADFALLHHRDIALLRELGGGTDLSTQLLGRGPPIIVDENGVGMIKGHAEPSVDTARDQGPKDNFVFTQFKASEPPANPDTQLRQIKGPRLSIVQCLRAKAMMILNKLPFFRTSANSGLSTTPTIAPEMKGEGSVTIAEEPGSATAGSLSIATEEDSLSASSRPEETYVNAGDCSDPHRRSSKPYPGNRHKLAVQPAYIDTTNLHEVVMHSTCDVAHSPPTSINGAANYFPTGTSNHQQYHSVQVSMPPGELLPPAPKAFFGRDELVEEIVGCAEKLESTALVGAGGIGKSSIVLAALHHDHIKERFGDSRLYIPCDQFPASSAQFLARISKAISAGAETPEDLESLQPHLSSKEMFIVLDNAESILDPQGIDAREIHIIVEELSHLSNVCLCITSRIATVPPHFKSLEIPMLSMEAARDIFYSIYSNSERSGIIDNFLQHLDFHALSITLLATTASENTWNYDQLVKQWNIHRAQALRTDHNEGLAATIGLSLNSPTFRKLGPDACDLLGVVAFFPQGIDEKNLEWFFPTVPDRKHIFDTFGVLSLTYRSNGFITMLAPIRDYLCPQDPKLSPLLCATKDRYFTRLSVNLDPNKPEFREARWIKLEDLNVEHLLDIFTSTDTNTLDVWDPCVHFMRHLYWHKPQQTVLTSKIKGLPDNHPSKPSCLFELSQLFGSVGNYPEEKELLIHTLMLEREWGDESRVARTLRFLSRVNWMLGLYEEGIQQAEEALEFYKRVGDTLGEAECLNSLAWLLILGDQPDAAEDVVLRTIDSLPEGQDYLLCQSYHVLGAIYGSKGEKEKAIDHYETALGIASPFDWQEAPFWIHYALATLLSDEDEFDNANAHIERAKSYTSDDTYNLGRAMGMQAWIWYRQHRLEDARCETLCALQIYEKLGATQDVRLCRELLQIIQRGMESSSAPDTGVCDTPPIASTKNSQGAGTEGSGTLSHS